MLKAPFQGRAKAGSSGPGSLHPVDCMLDDAEYSRLTLITACVIIWYMIRSFKCEDTEALSKGRRVRQFVNIARVARRKLRQLEISSRLDDLRIPPGNHLEALKGDRSGQYSIRINDQWRVCFRWTDAGAENVEIVDYH